MLRLNVLSSVAAGRSGLPARALFDPVDDRVEPTGGHPCQNQNRFPHFVLSLEPSQRSFLPGWSWPLVSW